MKKVPSAGSRVTVPDQSISAHCPPICVPICVEEMDLVATGVLGFRRGGAVVEKDVCRMCSDFTETKKQHHLFGYRLSQCSFLKFWICGDFLQWGYHQLESMKKEDFPFQFSSSYWGTHILGKLHVVNGICCEKGPPSAARSVDPKMGLGVGLAWPFFMESACCRCFHIYIHI